MAATDISMAEIDIEDNRLTAGSKSSRTARGKRSKIIEIGSNIAALLLIRKALGNFWPTFTWEVSGVKLTPDQVEHIRKGTGC